MTHYQHDYFVTRAPRIGDNEYLGTPQKLAYVRVFDHFASRQNRPHAIVTLPTGVGKTGLMALLPYGIATGRVLIVTPQLVIRDHVADLLDTDYVDNLWLKQNVFDRMTDLVLPG